MKMLAVLNEIEQSRWTDRYILNSHLQNDNLVIDSFNFFSDRILGMAWDRVVMVPRVFVISSTVRESKPRIGKGHVRFFCKRSEALYIQQRIRTWVFRRATLLEHALQSVS